MKCEDRLKNFIKKRKSTLLGIGPMSQNCVDAVIELGKDYKLPLMLIPSRRQIDDKEHGGGYVNNWTTETFSEYVKKRDPEGNIILARDHGGPWQNYSEVDKKMDLQKAMESSRRSFEVDIKSGFQIIHIDPSIDIHKTISQDEVLERLFELYEYCYEAAQKYGKEVIFEFGTDEQSGEQQELEELKNIIQKTLDFCKNNSLPKPFFLVVQTGTRVKETRNVGNINDATRVRGVIPPEVYISKIVEMCEQYGLHLKEHNVDYLSDEILSWHPRIGIHAVNVAPEFGVFETKHILKICGELNLKKEEEMFLELAYESRKWDKWLLPDSNTTDYDKAVIAGHYVFANERFKEIKKSISSKYESTGFDLDKSIKEGLKYAIGRYLYHFNLI